MINYQEQISASPVLDDVIHKPLISNIENVAKAANVPVSMIWTSAKDFCLPEELNYITEVRRKSMTGVSGLMFTGESNSNIALRMRAMASFCLRNYIDAKVMPLHNVLLSLKKESLPSNTVLLIPDFFVENTKIADWQLSSLLGLLHSRQGGDLQTVLYIEDLDSMAVTYGAPFHSAMSTFDQVAA